MKYIIIIFFGTILTSCSYNTEISYRLNKNQELIKEDGFIMSCIKDDNSLIVETFTPKTSGKDYYYDELEGKKSTKEINISNVKLHFVNSIKTVIPQKKQGTEDYYFTSNNLNDLIDKNKTIKIYFYVTDIKNGDLNKFEYTLHRIKNTYSTGTWPHS